MRVVFDTNILISALPFPGGRGEAALRKIIDERDELALSRPMLDELLGTLARKFSHDAEELAHVAVLFPTSQHWYGHAGGWPSVQANQTIVFSSARLPGVPRRSSPTVINYLLCVISAVCGCGACEIT